MSTRIIRFSLFSLLAAIAGLGLSSCQSSDIAPQDSLVRTVQVAQGLENPWSLAFLPDGRALVTERRGDLRLVDAEGNLSAPITGVPDVASNGQGGLLDIVLSPDFESTALVFFSFSERTSDGLLRTAVARANLNDTALSNVVVIYRQQLAFSSDIHFGSRLVFDTSGNLLVTLGDRNQRDSAQQTDNGLGKVIRIRPDGNPAPDNPFVGDPGSSPDVFTYGHRNPQGATRDPVTGEIWIHEHGPQGGDEVNRLIAGANYGWPRITYGVEYGSGASIGEGTAAVDVEPPVYHWIPVSIAPAGMVFYTGDRVPELTGKLLLGALAGRALISLTMENGQVSNEQAMLESLNERIRDVRQAPDGYPYLLTDSGKLLRVESQ